MAGFVYAHAAPALGTAVALLLFLAPWRDVHAAFARRELGAINPLPFPLLAANCVGWIGYGYLLRDYYVVIANINGLALATHYTLLSLALCGPSKHEARRTQVHGVVLVSAVALAYVGLVVALPLAGERHDELRKSILGAFCNFILVLFYACPLTEVREVLRTRNSDALLFPLCVMNIINGSAWAIYGFALGDYFLASPNALGACFGMLQCALCAVFPKSKPPAETTGAPLPAGGEEEAEAEA